MKAALWERLERDSDLFHQGMAKESKDPDVIAATMSKPGVILRRPVGSHGIKEDANLPTHLLGDGSHRPKKLRAKPKKYPPARSTKKPTARLLWRSRGGVKAIAGRKRPLGRGTRAQSAGNRQPQAALEEAEWEHEEGRNHPRRPRCSRRKITS